MKVLIVSNGAAARARRGVPALRQAVPEAADRTHHLTERPEELLALVGHPRWQADDMLVINGGDGTVQHVLTALLAHCPSDRLPRIACLPGGTTNMTAYDLNVHRRFGDCLETLRRALAPGGRVAPEPRSAVRVRDRAGGLRCGLFFGTGTIVQGIEYFHERIRYNGGGHELGAGAALVRTLWGIARHEPPFSEPLVLHMRAPALLAAQGSSGDDDELSVRLLLVTTLDRLFLGIRPYWGSGPGALKATLVERRAPGFVRRMPRLLRGRPNRDMSPAHGYHSARLDNLTLAFHGSYTLDGELFSNPDEPIDISATERLKFLPL